MSHAGSAASSTEVTSKHSSNKWFAIAALAVIGLIGWSLTFGSGDGPASDDQAGIERGEGTEPAVALAGDSPAATPEEVAEDEEMETEEVDKGPVDSTDPGASVPVASTPDEENPLDLALLNEAGEAVVLAEPIGFALLVSGHGSGSLVDLESHRVVELPKFRGDVILVTATHLVLATESGRPSSISFDDLGASPIGLDVSDNWPQLSIGDSEESAWALTYSNEDGSQTRTLINLATGEAIRSVSLPASVSPVGLGPSDLVNAIGGGVHEETSEGNFRRFANGWALAATDELVLVRRCSAELSCTGLWMDRRSGATLDYPSPDVQNTQWWGAGIDSTNTWYWSQDPRNRLEEGMSLVSIQTGREIVLSGMEPWPGPAISPDGRWATYSDQRLGQVKLVGLESGQVLHLAQVVAGSRVDFVPLSVMNQFPQDG